MSIGNDNIHQQGEIPEIVKLPNNRIRVIRRFQKFTREDVDNVNLGSLMGDFGDLDTADEQILNQGYSNCRLISVEVDTRFNQQANADNAVLVKTYETLTNEFVEISSDTQEIGESNLKKITKVYRAISGATSNHVVGTTLLDPEANPSDGIRLASSKIEDNTGFAELTEEYIESGVLSLSQSHRYGNKVEVYSVEGINITADQARAAITNLPADAKFYGKKISNLLGLETNTFEFFTGSGVISNLETKSHNNKLIKTTIVSIDDEPVAPSGSVLIESKSEARDEFVLYTYTFVSGQGVVSTETSNKYGVTLDVVTITSINEQPVVPSGAFTKEALVREESGYLLYSTTYASGSGQIGTSSEEKYNGDLLLTTKTCLNEVPSSNGALIRQSINETDYGTVYTYTFAEGSGEIGKTVEKKYNDKLILTTRTSLNEVPNGSGALINSSVQDTDYGAIYTYTYAEGEGEIGSSTENKYNNQLTLTTLTSLNIVPTHAGEIVNSREQSTDYGVIYTYTFAEGEGEIGSREVKKYDDKLTLTTKTSLNIAPDESGALISSDIQSTDYGEIYTYTFAEGEGEIGKTIENKYDDKLTLTTITSLEEVPDESGTLIKENRQDSDYGIIYTYTFAEGSGEIGRSEVKKYNDKLTLITVTSLDEVPDEDGALINSSFQDTDYGKIYTYTFADGEGEIGKSIENKYDNKLTLTTVTSLNEVPDEDGYLVRSSQSSNDYGIIYAYTYADGEGQIGLVETEKYGGKLQIRTETYLNQPNPDPPSDFILINTDSRDGDFGIIVIYTYAKGAGQISYNTENRPDGSNVKTYVYLGLEEKPDELSGTDYYLLEESVQASEGYDIHTYYLYKKPADYTVDVETSWNRPANLGWNREEGFHIDQVGTMDPISALATVTFSDQAPSGIALSDLSVGAVARESVKYDDGTRLVRSTAFSNTYYGGQGGVGGAIQGGDYLGEPIINGVVSTSGQELPQGQVTLGWESVPYFYAGGTTIWKTTHTTGTI
jgi:hypothetical protein